MSAAAGLGQWSTMPSNVPRSRTAALLAASLDVGVGTAGALLLSGLLPKSSRLLHQTACRKALRDMGITLSIIDHSGSAREPGRPALYVHLDQQTLLSTVIYPLVIPQRFSLIVNWEFALLPLIGWLTVAQGAVVISRQHPSQARNQMKRAAARMQSGESFGMSIEGRRSHDGRLSPYKKGAVILAIDAQCDIVPFMTHGEWPLWPRGQRLPRSGQIEAVLYPSIRTQGLTHADRDGLVSDLRSLAERERAARGIPA